MAENSDNVLGKELAGPAGEQLAARDLRKGKNTDYQKMRRTGAGLYKASKKMGNLGKVLGQEEAAINRLGKAQDNLGKRKDNNLRGRLLKKLKKIKIDKNQAEEDEEGKEEKPQEDEKFDGWIFYVILFLSVLKDALDLAHVLLGAATAGVLYIIGFIVIWIANIVITALLAIFFFIKYRNSQVAMRFLKKFIVPIIVEFIPAIKLFPTYTAMTIYLRIKGESKMIKRVARVARINRARSVKSS